jgi:hypothetical protein
MRSYSTEIEGQIDFYTKIGINPDLYHHTDGVDRGNLYENKLNINDLNKVLFQAIKYASRIRERGEPLPANIILNDLTLEKVYIFSSIDVLDDIEKVYIGGASKNNDNYIPPQNLHNDEIDYSNSIGLYKLLSYVNSNNFVRYHIDRNNILGLAQQFYKKVQDKDKFINGPQSEIRNPNILKDIIIPYTKSDNIEFKEIMDCLNPKLLQREQGAFYTPVGYVKEMQKMLLKAVSEVPVGYDYLIIDRCAGVGNLEEGLPEDVLSHCVLSTIEPNEYQILRYKFGDLCSVIVPTTNALDYDIIPAERDKNNNVIDDFIREKVNNPKCVIILVENPPFSEAGAGSMQLAGIKTNPWKESYVCKEFKKENEITKQFDGTVSNDLANLFIWSGFKYYLKNEHDSYILFSPLKYWRNQKLANKQYKSGFLCNRNEFHATPAVIGCIWWKNLKGKPTTLKIPAYDIVNNKLSKVIPTAVPFDEDNNLIVKQASKNLSLFYDKSKDSCDKLDGVLCKPNGTEYALNGKERVKPLFNVNIIGYLMANNFSPDPKNVGLVRTGLFKGNGFFLRSDNFIEKLPLFVTSLFPANQWWEKDLYSKSFDGEGSYLTDKDFLKNCLIYTSLIFKNKCKSFIGSDNRFYRNELCFDGNTLSQVMLDKLISSGVILSKDEKELFIIWNDIVVEAKKTIEYKNLFSINSNLTLGLWQIKEDINIDIPTGKNKHGKTIFSKKYAVLNTSVVKLDKALKSYYKNIIIPDLFKYELIK